MLQRVILEEEKELSDAARMGDIDALGALFERHRERIQRFLQKRLGNQADIEDLVQNVFLEMSRTITAYEGRSAFSTWILGISMNLIRNHYSRSPTSRYQFVEIDEISSLAGPEPDDPAAKADSEQQFQQLREVIAELPANLRDPLVLVIYQGLSYDEAAECLGIGLSALKSRIFRARGLLRQQFDEISH